MEEIRRIYTLAELGKSLRSVIERNYTSAYWIKAEIAKLNYYPRSGHCYPELVDKSGETLQAQMRATIWAADFQRINRKFQKITSNELKEGMFILFRASISFHPVYGLSLQIRDIEPSFTLGEMAMIKSQNIEGLKKEGVFGQNKTLSIPLLPKRVAVISVETSKGYSDFLNIIEAQSQNYAVWHYLFPSLLQGDKAAENILSQLRIIKKARERFDMVAIIRGGGGDIGLSCYDDYNLSREIATFPLPVITGIGHSTNETIAEMVAWANKITPTDVGYFIVEKFHDFAQRIQQASQSLSNQTMRLLQLHKQNLGLQQEKLQYNTPAMLQRAQKQQDLLLNTLLQNTVKLTNLHNEKIDHTAYRLSVTPGLKITENRCSIDQYQKMLQSNTRSFYTSQRASLASLDEKLRLLDPENILKRGYSITRNEGKSITDASRLTAGTIIQTTLYSGTVESKVTMAKPSDKKTAD